MNRLFPLEESAERLSPFDLRNPQWEQIECLLIGVKSTPVRLTPYAQGNFATARHRVRSETCQAGE